MKSRGSVDWPVLKEPLPLVVTLESEGGRKGAMQPTNTTATTNGLGWGVDGSSAHSLFFLTERRPFMPRGHEDAQKPLSIGRDGLWHLRSSAGGWYLQFCRIDDTNTHVLAFLLVRDKKDTSFGHLFFYRGPKFWTERLYLSPPGDSKSSFCLTKGPALTDQPVSNRTHSINFAVLTKSGHGLVAFRVRPC